MANLSSFPSQIDQFLLKTEMTASDVPYVARFQELKLKASRTSAEEAELASLTTQLRSKLIAADEWNKFADAVINMENFIKTEVDGYIQTMQANVDITKDAALALIESKKANIIQYMDSTTAGEMRNDIGMMTDLVTTNKDSLVGAVNEHVTNYKNHTPYALATGSANTYVATLSPALTTYAAGVSIAVQINVANTSASTININGLGAKTILDSKGNALTSGKLKANLIYTLRYNGTNFILQGEGGGGTATAAQVLTGYTATNDAGDVNGTMPNRAGDTSAISSSVSGTTLKLLPSNGYRDGVDDNVTITSADFTAANIVKNKNVFGITGTFDKIYGSGDTLIAGSMFSSKNTLTPTVSPGNRYGLASGTVLKPDYVDPLTGESYVNDSYRGSESAYTLTKYNTSGNVVWTRNVGQAFGFRWMRYDGTFTILYGTTYIRIDKNNTVVESKTMNIPVTYTTLVEDYNGNFIVTCPTDSTIKKYSKTFSQVWSVSFTYNYNRGWIDGVDKSGNFLVTRTEGGSQATTGDTDSYYVYNSSGAVIYSWQEVPKYSNGVYYSATTWEGFDSETGYFVRCWDNHWSTGFSIYNLATYGSGPIRTVATGSSDHNGYIKILGYTITWTSWTWGNYWIYDSSYNVLSDEQGKQLPLSISYPECISLDEKGDLMVWGNIDSVSRKFCKVARVYQYSVI